MFTEAHPWTIFSVSWMHFTTLTANFSKLYFNIILSFMTSYIGWASFLEFFELGFVIYFSLQPYFLHATTISSCCSNYPNIGIGYRSNFLYSPALPVSFVRLSSQEPYLYCEIESKIRT
jgi:hypothetical protein